MRTDAELVLSELRCSVERLQTLVEAMLERAELDKMAEAREVADSLAAEVKERKRREEEMKDLVRCEDHIHYLQVTGRVLCGDDVHYLQVKRMCFMGTTSTTSR